MKQIILFVLLAISINATAQVAINNSGSNPNASAMLDVSSTNKGMLMPRMNAQQRKAIANPEPGLLVYDLDRQTPYLFDGSQWRPLMFTSEKQLPLVERGPEGDDPGSSGWGSDVAIWQDYIVVGASTTAVNGNAFQGAAYVYHRSDGTWKLQQKLIAPNGAANDVFGESVAIYNDIVVVGAPKKTVLGEVSAGSAYIFKRSGTVWTHQQTITALNPQSSDIFGSRVAAANGKIAIAAPQMDYNGIVNSGAVFLYEYLSNTYTLTKQFKAQQPILNGDFGRSIAMDENDVVIGYPGYVLAPYGGIGSVNVFSYQPASGLWQESILLADEKQADMQFGAAVDFDGDSLIVGAPDFDSKVNSQIVKNNIGKVLVFKRTNGAWTPVYNYNEIMVTDSRMGYEVALNDGYMMYSSKGLDAEDEYVFMEAMLPNRTTRYSETHENVFKGFGRASAMQGGYFVLSGRGENGAGSFKVGMLK